MPSAMLKMDVLTPTPRAMVRIAAAEKPRFLRRTRMAYRTS